ncbi:hypothetical protein [Phyllobacterium sp. SB3]|uniref:hypothetical protein n=1 Tax=Phyllobacterium sp. SB3 TaxID=3156073 RepID=UPI0032B002BC
MSRPTAHAQLFMWQYASRIRSKQHEPRDEFRVNPSRFGPYIPTGGECFDLGGWQLPGRDPDGVEGGPQSPFLSASGLEANQCDQFKSELLMTFNLVRQPRALAFWQTVDIQPIATNIYTDNPCL